MLGICRQVTPYANVMKLGTVGLVGYVIALTAVGPHRLTGFGVSRHPSWVPSIDKAHRAYYTAVPATAGTHDFISYSRYKTKQSQRNANVNKCTSRQENKQEN